MSKLTDTDTKITALVKKVRNNAGLTQKDAAAIMGVSVGQFIKYETGKDRIGAAKLFALAVATKTPIGELFPYE